MTKILMISTDKKILEEGSSVRNRMLFLAKNLDEMEIIVLGKNSPEQKFGNVKAVGYSRFSALFLKRGDISVVTSQDPFETGIISFFIARRSGAKLHLQIHTDFLDPYFLNENINNPIRVNIAHFLIPKASGVRVVSEKIKETLSGFVKNLPPVSVLPVFVDKEKIKNLSISSDLHAKYPNFEKIVLIASRLTKEKDIPLALAGFKEVLQAFPKAGLVIVGSGPEEGFIKSEIVRLGIEASVKIESWADYPTTISYMKSADVFLTTSFYEGYGMTLIEASICKLAIVATDVGIASEVGAYITERNAVNVSKKLTEALSRGASEGGLDVLDAPSYQAAFKQSLNL